MISVAQFFGTVPLIQKSEVYERKAAEAPPAAHEHVDVPHDHTLAHNHESEWEPEDGFQRNAFTVAANICLHVLFYSNRSVSRYCLAGSMRSGAGR